MKKTDRKSLHFVGTLALVLTLLAGCGQAQGAPEAKSAPAPVALAATTHQEKLVVVLNGAGDVTIAETDGGTLVFSGAQADYDYRVSGPVSGVTTVTIRQKSGADYAQGTLSVPQGSFSNIRAELNDTDHLCLEPKTANYELAGEESALSLFLSSAYTGTLATNLTDCAVGLTLGGPPKNLRVSLSAEDCAISVPAGWQKGEDKPFALTRGTGGAMLNLKFKNCALSITETAVDLTSRYSGAGPFSMTCRTGKQDMLVGTVDGFTAHGGSGAWDTGREIDAWRAKAKPNTVTGAGSVSAQGVTALRVNANLCGVVLEPSESGDFECTYVGVQQPGEITLSTEVKGGVLTVTAEGTRVENRYINVTPEYRVNCVRVGVPAWKLTALTVDCGVGIIAANGITVPAITGVAGSGMVIVNGDTLSTPVNMSTSNGTLAVNAKTVAAAVKLNTTNGSANLKADIVTAPVELTATNGSVKAEVGTATAKLTLSAQNGSVEVKADRVGDAEVQARNGSVEAAFGTITGDVLCGVTNGTLEAALTRKPTDLTFHVTGGWGRADDKDDDWDWNDQDEKGPYGLPGGWYDGLVLGSGKPTLTLSASTNGFLSLTAPK